MIVFLYLETKTVIIFTARQHSLLC